MNNPYHRQAKEYRYQEVMGASSMRLIIITCDAAIAACHRRDLVAGTRALAVLRNSLNFQYAEIANGLLALYLWCADLLREEKWEEAVTILAELRGAWAQAEQQVAAANNATTVASPKTFKLETASY